MLPIIADASAWWTWFAAIDLFMAAGMGLLLLWTDLRIPLLKRVPADARSDWPKVSIVVAARNEERNLEHGVRSLLSLDYPALQITVVNDRSTDQTGPILQRIAAEEPRLNVVTVADLPAGWLGKNHAMQCGADASDGEWLLFTDADVVFEPTALRRGITHAEQQQLDHLAVTPVVESPSWWLRAFIPVFSMCFLIYLKAWALRKRHSSAYVGIGAFNLIRHQVYTAIGGHSKIRLRPDDDIKLGKVLKQAGYLQDLAVGRGLLEVEWYRTFWELVRGLEKNTFAGVDYRPWITIGAACMMIVQFIVPFVAPFFTTGPACLMFACAAACYVAFAIRACLQNAQPWWLGFAFPLGVLAFLLIQLRTMCLNLWQGGIHWRDTFYPLSELRQNRV